MVGLLFQHYVPALQTSECAGMLTDNMRNKDDTHTKRQIYKDMNNNVISRGSVTRFHYKAAKALKNRVMRWTFCEACPICRLDGSTS